MILNWISAVKFTTFVSLEYQNSFWNVYTDIYLVFAIALLGSSVACIIHRKFKLWKLKNEREIIKIYSCKSLHKYWRNQICRHQK